MTLEVPVAPLLLARPWPLGEEVQVPALGGRHLARDGFGLHVCKGPYSGGWLVNPAWGGGSGPIRSHNQPYQPSCPDGQSSTPTNLADPVCDK